MKTLDFGLGTLYDNGTNVGVGLTEAGLAVEVHQSPSVLLDLYYHVGVLSNGSVFWTRSAKYDDGTDPDIAINKHNQIVEVHASGGIVQRLWYHVGTATSTKIDFKKSYKYDSGIQPAVALNDSNLVVEVHKAQTKTDLWYRIGKVTGDAIKWSDHAKYAGGTNPTVAVNNHSQVVEIHESGIALAYRIGTVDGSGKLKWASSSQNLVGRGDSPSVALKDDGAVAVVYEVNGELVSQVGQLGTKDITWQPPSAPFDEGEKPALALAGDIALQSHYSGGDSLWCSTSLLIDRKNWMKSTTQLAKKPLWKTTLPGTHDSGAFNLTKNRCPSTCSDAPSWIPKSFVQKYGTAQDRNMQQQLEGGIRYFDWRAIYYNSDFYTYHDAIGPLMSEQIDHLADFLKNTSGEIVILQISHFCSFGDDQHKALVKQLKDKLGSYMYTGDAGQLLTTTISSLTNSGSRVVINYVSSYLDNHPAKGFYKDLKIYDKYSNTDDYKTMWKDQLGKLSQNPGSASQLFLLSFTLTFQNWKSLAKGGSLHKISEAANRNLGEFVNAYCTQYQTNVLYVDFYQDARATDLAIWLNRR